MSAQSLPTSTHTKSLYVPLQVNGDIETSYEATFVRSDRTLSKRKAKILLEATRDFCRAKRPEALDVTKYKEFFYQFIESVGPSDKRIVSAMLARVPFTPRSIALYLSLDTLEVAAPFLLFSPVLGEADLRAIGEKKGVDYKRVMARRQGPDVVFVKFDDLENAKEDEKPIINISAPIESKNKTTLSGDEIMALAGAGGRLGRGKQKKELSPQKITSAIEKSKPTHHELYEHARSGDKVEFSEAASNYSGLQSEEILRLMTNETGDELVYLIKALGFEPSKDVQLLMMLSPRYGRSLDAYKRAKNLFNELEVGICQIIFNKVGAKFELSGAPKPVRIDGIRGDNGFARALGERQEHAAGSRAKLTRPSDARQVFGKKAS